MAVNRTRLEALALHLASGGSAVDWARAHLVNARTASHWAARPDVRARVGELQGELFARATGKLAGQLDKALDALDGLLAAGTPHATLLAAIRTVLGEAREMRSFVDIESRLAALEAKLFPPDPLATRAGGPRLEMPDSDDRWADGEGDHEEP